MKHGMLLLFGVLLFVCCSPNPAFLSETMPPTTKVRETAIPVIITNLPTIEASKQEPSPIPFTPSVRLLIDEETVEPTATLPEPLTITIVYDNLPFDERLKPAWGFAALVEYQAHTLLFDTGGDGPTLMENMRVLGIDPGRIETVVLSHAHSDHTGGLNALLEFGAQPVVFVPPSFPASFERQVREKTELAEVVPGQMIADGIFTTGEMGQGIAEQALVIKTDTGLVIITGCAHPGIISMVERAQSLFDQPVRLVLGGFHLGSRSQAEIKTILRDFRRLNVEQVAPSHCTGAQAIDMFASEYGVDLFRVGVGKIISLDVLDS